MLISLWLMPAKKPWSELSYSGMHTRLTAKRGRPTVCAQCGATDKKITWANVSGQYLDEDDFVGLCYSCHNLRDLTDETRAIRGKRIWEARRRNGTDRGRGGGFRGPHTEEAKAKMRAAKLGRKRT